MADLVAGDLRQQPKTWLRLNYGIDKGLLVAEPAPFQSPASRFSARAWMDEDGKHVWIAHDCTDHRDVSMMPWPTWQQVDNGMVRPSFVHDTCGIHVLLETVWELADV